MSRIKIKIMMVVVGMVLALMAAGAGAAVYYVDPAGSDAAAGTAAAPVKTIQVGKSKLKAGDVLNVRAAAGATAAAPTVYAGVSAGYDPDGLYGPLKGTQALPIVIQADPLSPAGSVAITSNSNKETDGITLSGCAWVTVRGITVKNVNNKIFRDGIRVVTSNNITITGCDVSGMVRFGISCTNTQNILFEGNVVHDNPGKGDAFTGHGIYVAQNTTGAIVRGNIIRKNGYQGLHLNADRENGGTANISAVIEDNFFDSNTGNSLNMDGASNCLIQRNRIIGQTKTGISIYAIDAPSAPAGNRILNNTIFSPGSSGSAVQLAGGATITGNVLIGGSEGAIVKLAGATVTESNNLKSGTAALFVDAAAGDYRLKDASATYGAYPAGSPPPTTQPTDPYAGWVQADARADVNGDGVVNILDQLLIANNFGARTIPGRTGIWKPPTNGGTP